MSLVYFPLFHHLRRKSSWSPAARSRSKVPLRENENKKLDRNWLRLPTEQWGMSNNPKHSLSAPSFSDACFRLEGDKWIHVRLQ